MSPFLIAPVCICNDLHTQHLVKIFSANIGHAVMHPHDKISMQIVVLKNRKHFMMLEEAFSISVYYQ